MSDTFDGKRVLLVDDEEMVLTLGRVILERHGCSVMVATSGEEAVARCREATESPDCAIIDYTMPGMNGRETLVELRGIVPGLKAIIASGYGDDVICQELGTVEVSGFVQKPYRQEALLNSLRDVLGIE